MSAKMSPLGTLGGYCPQPHILHMLSPYYYWEITIVLTTENYCWIDPSMENAQNSFLVTLYVVMKESLLRLC